MIIEAFLRWTERAAASDRAKAARSLATAFVQATMSLEDRRAAEAALTFLLDDPSPKVRLAIAAAFADSVEAPRTIVHALSRDQIEVASHVVALSPVLSDGDLVDIVADGVPEIQRVVAMRRSLSVAVSAALAEVAGSAAVCDLLENEEAAIASITIRRIVERFGDVSEVRACLLERTDLPCDMRHEMVVHVSEALAASGLVKNMIGDSRISRVTREARQQATLHLAADVPADELPALVEHLRIRGQLTTALLMHTLCQGNIDFFAAAIVSLSGQSPSRVRGIIVDGRAATMQALYARAEIGPAVARIFVSATLIWRDASRRGALSTPGLVADLLIQKHGREADMDRQVADLLMLVEKLNFSYRRRIAREEALSMAVRAA